MRKSTCFFCVTEGLCIVSMCLCVHAVTCLYVCTICSARFFKSLEARREETLQQNTGSSCRGVLTTSSVFPLLSTFLPFFFIHPPLGCLKLPSQSLLLSLIYLLPFHLNSSGILFFLTFFVPLKKQCLPHPSSNIFFLLILSSFCCPLFPSHPHTSVSSCLPSFFNNPFVILFSLRSTISCFFYHFCPSILLSCSSPYLIFSSFITSFYSSPPTHFFPPPLIFRGVISNPPSLFLFHVSTPFFTSCPHHFISFFLHVWKLIFTFSFKSPPLLAVSLLSSPPIVSSPFPSNSVPTLDSPTCQWGSRVLLQCGGRCGALV